jgi:hypothetical protein
LFGKGLYLGGRDGRRHEGLGVVRSLTTADTKLHLRQHRVNRNVHRAGHTCTCAFAPAPERAAVAGFNLFMCRRLRGIRSMGTALVCTGGWAAKEEQEQCIGISFCWRLR